VEHAGHANLLHIDVFAVHLYPEDHSAAVTSRQSCSRAPAWSAPNPLP
jgi:hypothetical protein